MKSWTLPSSAAIKGACAGFLIWQFAHALVNSVAFTFLTLRLPHFYILQLTPLIPWIYWIGGGVVGSRLFFDRQNAVRDGVIFAWVGFVSSAAYVAGVAVLAICQSSLGVPLQILTDSRANLAVIPSDTLFSTIYRWAIAPTFTLLFCGIGICLLRSAVMKNHAGPALPSGSAGA